MGKQYNVTTVKEFNTSEKIKIGIAHVIAFKATKHNFVLQVKLFIYLFPKKEGPNNLKINKSFPNLYASSH